MATEYTINLGFDRLRIQADLSQASAQIRYLGADDEWHSTPYQTADASHRVRDAARLVVRYLGREYYLDPTVTLDRADEDTYVDGLIRSIEESA